MDTQNSESPRLISARNRLPGVITRVKRGDVVSQVEMQVGDNHIVAVITTEAADEMGLQEGMEAVATFKSTSVMISTSAHGDGGSL